MTSKKQSKEYGSNELYREVEWRTRGARIMAKIDIRFVDREKEWSFVRERQKRRSGAGGRERE